MDWTDTIMLESNRYKSFFDDTRLQDRTNVDAVKAVSARVMAVQGISMIHAVGRGPEELAAALEILRGFRATGRRVVLCNASLLTPDRQIGRSLVSDGGAEAVISCGTHGRDLAIGARDAGLDLASVVVCQDVKAACEATVRRLGPGDTLLLWGVDQEACNRLAMWIDKHFAKQVHVAA